MTVGDAAHWESAYAEGDTTRSWYQEHADHSARLIERLAPDRATAVIDVGGGASTLVDDLIDLGYRDLTVLDLAPSGLDLARQRLGPDRSASVDWVTADILAWRPDRTYTVWHDRAVLHFMTDPAAQSAYRSSLLAATEPGALAILGVFGPNGPQSCSGLPVARFDSALLAQALGPRFRILESSLVDHTTPSGARQEFLWAVAIRD